jgi:cytochrome P450
MAAVTDPAADELLAALLLTPEGRSDPYPLYIRLRESTPVLRSSLGPIVLTRYADALAVLRDPRMGRGLLGPRARTESRDAMWSTAADPALRRQFFERAGNNMLFADPPDHGRLRRLVSRAFTPRRIDALRPAVAEMVGRYCDQMLEAGTVDVMAVLAFPLPNWVIGELVGVPPADRTGFQDLVRLGAAAIEPIIDEETTRRAIGAQAELGQYFTELLAQRRRQPEDDLMTGLAEARERDDALTDEEIVSTAILLFAAGFETTTNLIGNGLWALLHHPGEMDRLRRDPDLAPGAVEELLRWDSPVQVNFRTALEDTELDGEPIPAGQQMLVLQGAANRDPARFPDPERLDLGRPDNVPLSFGWGAHHCIGAALARMEGEEVFRALVTRFGRIEAVGPAPAWRSGMTLHGLESLEVEVSPAA